LLITQRPPTGHLAGLWEFPGGKREPGESFEECLRRELKEELHIEVEPVRLAREIEHAYPEKTVRLRFIVCRLSKGTPQAIGCQAFAWVHCEKLGDFAFPEADRQLLEELQNSPDWLR
jgi:mutator protein MutT